MRQGRLVQLVCALLGALASLIVIIEYLNGEDPQRYSKPSAPPSATATPLPEVVPPLPTSTPEPEGSQFVYRTPSGKRYHRATCGHVKGKEMAVSLAEAEEQGLTPCRVCNPPPTR